MRAYLYVTLALYLIATWQQLHKALWDRGASVERVASAVTAAVGVFICAWAAALIASGVGT